MKQKVKYDEEWNSPPYLTIPCLKMGSPLQGTPKACFQCETRRSSNWWYDWNTNSFLPALNRRTVPLRLSGATRSWTWRCTFCDCTGATVPFATDSWINSNCQQGDWKKINWRTLSFEFQHWLTNSIVSYLDFLDLFLSGFACKMHSTVHPLTFDIWLHTQPLIFDVYIGTLILVIERFRVWGFHLLGKLSPAFHVMCFDYHNVNLISYEPKYIFIFNRDHPDYRKSNNSFQANCAK